MPETTEESKKRTNEFFSSNCSVHELEEEKSQEIGEEKKVGDRQPKNEEGRRKMKRGNHRRLPHEPSTSIFFLPSNSSFAFLTREDCQERGKRRPEWRSEREIGYQGVMVHEFPE